MGTAHASGGCHGRTRAQTSHDGAAVSARRPWSHHLPNGRSEDFDPPSQSVLEGFARSVHEHGARTAIEYYGERLSYDELGQRAAAVAAALTAHGIRPGERVALYLPNTPFHPIWFFGVLWSGAVVTHFSPMDAPRELSHKARDSGARLVVTLSTPPFATRALALKAAGEVADVVVCDDPISLGEAEPVFDGAIRHHAFVGPHSHAPLSQSRADGADLALLQYTGGTTGVPKAAMLTHRNLAAAVDIYAEWFRGTSESGPHTATLNYLPLFHIMALTTCLLRRTCEGGMIVLRQRFDAAEALDAIEEHKITALAGVPTLWLALVQHPGIEGRDLSSLNYVASGGAPLSVELFRRVRALTGLSLRGGWGMTETAPAGTIIPDELPEEKLATIGVPLPGIDLTIGALDDPARTLGPGEVGEIRIKGVNVTAGYWQRPEETAASFVDGWLLTGDIGRMDEDGFFYIVDRKKDMIVSSGFNVYPLAIENAVAEHPAVGEVLVIGVPDEYRGEAAKAFIALRPGAERFSLEELHAFLAERLGRHEMPREIEFRDALPRTAVGKASRRALKEELAAVSDASAA